MNKKCKECKIEKNISAYAKDMNICRSCKSNRDKIYYQKKKKPEIDFENLFIGNYKG